MRFVYAAFLLLLGAWGVFVSYKHISAKQPWCPLRWVTVLCLALLAGGCFTSGVALLAARFAPWMLLPIGISYVIMLPLPCYFPSVTATHGRRAVRNTMFAVFASFLLALGFGIIPLSLIGL